MIKIATILCALLFAISPAYSQDAKTKIAKVDYSEIESLIESVVLAKPENRDLKERFRAKQEKSEKAQQQMQTAIMKGEKFNPLESSLIMMHQARETKKVAALCEKHLLEVIETTLGDKYDIILRNKYGNSLLFTRVAIDDVTILLKQSLLKQLPTGKK